MNLVTIRASSLGKLFDCPASWAATYLEGKHLPASSKALLGKVVHASTAVFDQSKFKGAGYCSLLARERYRGPSPKSSITAAVITS